MPCRGGGGAGPRPAGRRRVDPSGVVKGWAADRACRHLAELDNTDFCLWAGGDIVCRASDGRAPWQIGIEDPYDLTRVIANVPRRSGSAANSGTAHRGAHLVDARTGRPADGLASRRGASAQQVPIGFRG